MAKTRGEEMLALRRARMAASPPILRGGYRPFFLGGAIWAIVALGIWMLVWLRGWQMPSQFSPLAWHRHEMLFGFVGAAIAGYLLTAIPNWSGKLPVAGRSLVALFALWLLGRVLNLTSAWAGGGTAMVVDVGFCYVLAGFLLREIFGTRKRNLPMAILLMLFGAANLVDHLEALGWWPDGALPPGIGVRAGIALVVVLISVVGGKLTPSFTRNLIIKRKLGGKRFGQPDRFDRAVIAATALGMAVWALAPDHWLTACALGAVAALQLARLLRWRGWKVRDDPIVVILHLGYLWIPLGLAILALSDLLGGLPLSAAVHALTAGAMATMILAVMTRTILGQTGRAPNASTGTVWAYGLVIVGAAVRVAAPVLPLRYDHVLIGAALLWGAGFAAFAWVYGRVLFAARIDNPYG